MKIVARGKNHMTKKHGGLAHAFGTIIGWLIILCVVGTLIYWSVVIQKNILGVYDLENRIQKLEHRLMDNNF